MPFLLTTTVPQPASLRLLAIGARLARGVTSRRHRRKTARSIGLGLGILVLVLGFLFKQKTAYDIMVSQVPDFQSAGLGANGTFRLLAFSEQFQQLMELPSGAVIVVSP